MFIDTAKIYLKAGDGGDGCNSFYRDRSIRLGRPDGGEGGDGGDVILLADKNVHTLLDFKYNRHFIAESGRNGSSNNKTGKNGKDRIVRIPLGTMVYDEKTGDLLRDLINEADSVRVCEGGAGGKGNSRGRPSTEGESGDEKNVILQLKLIADVGIVGFPNAGKSTLISRVSRAKSKIAGYPFTTKEPILGIVQFHDESFAIADMPGLIEGAHRGRGLGDKFLRHIERTKLLVHLVDMAAVDGRSPVEDYGALNEELKLYSSSLSKKPQIIAANKMDLTQADGNLADFKKVVSKKVYPISAQTGDGVPMLIKGIISRLKKNNHGRSSDE